MDPHLPSPSVRSLQNGIETAGDVERLFLRLVVADSDDKLQRFTDNHLIQLLEFAGNSKAALPQITELLTHYNKVVKTNLQISLPVKELVDLFQGANTHLSVVYLKFARERITDEEHLTLLPHFLKALETKGSTLSSAFELFGIFLRGILQLSKLDKQKWPAGVVPSEGAAAVLAMIFRAVLVFHAQTSREVEAVSKKVTASGGVQGYTNGLSPEQYTLVGTHIYPQNIQLSDLKIAIMKLLSNDFLAEKDAFPLVVLGASTNVNVVVDAAESALKTFDIQTMVDDKSVAIKLMELYLGSAALNQKPTNPMQCVLDGDVYQKQRILGFLVRSMTAQSIYMNNIKVCTDGIGNEVVKVQTLALQFLHKVIEKMPPVALKALGAQLFSRLRKLVRPATTASAPLSLIYRCLGTLGKQCSNLVFDDVTIVGEMLEVIPYEEEDVAYAVIDCLVAWLPSFCGSASTRSPEVTAKLREYIAENVTHDNSKCRLVSLKYIEALLDEGEMDLKWMLLNAVGDSRDEVRAEATRLLDMSLKKSVPSVELVVNHLYSKLAGDLEDSDGEELSSAKGVISPLTHQMCSKYIWAVCETTATGRPADLKVVVGDDLWLTVSPEIVTLVKRLDPAITEKSMKLALYAVRESLDVFQYRIAACFTSAHLLRTPTETLAKKFPNTLNACKLRIRDSTRIELSATIAHIVSQLVADSHPLRTEIYEAALAEFEQKNSIAGLCWTMTAAVCPVTLKSTPVASELSLMKSLQPLVTPLIDVLLKKITEGYDHPSSMLEASLGSLNMILSTYHANTVNIELNEANRKQILEVCEKIAASRKDSLSQKAREEATKVIGALADGQTDGSDLLVILYRIGEGPPQPELQISVGESLVATILGPYAPSRRNVFTTTEIDITADNVINDQGVRKLVDDRCTTLLKTLIDEKLVSQNHHLRRAAMVWLLVALQKLHVFNPSTFDKATLVDIQNSFADGLTENDEFTQDISSKGMGIVYSLADADLRKQLVASLMDALSEGRKTDRKVNSNTVLFAQGQLGKAPNGENLTTYKELCSLATDLNQPDLVYKFMQLAKHNSTWNAKKGAAFGFGVVLEQAREEMLPFLPQLVPKLFRYRYDPDIKVQQSMRSIWSVLTSQKRNVVDEYADEIAKELIPTLTHKEWRARESACLALSDLLRGHDTVWMHSQLPCLLETTLRVRDDIKESVRLAADKTAEAIRRLIVRLATSTNREKADGTLNAVLPVVIDKGILNASVKNNKIFCLSLLLELSKTAGKQLKPHLPLLIPTLLDAISDSESAVLNYLAVRSDNQQLEALDDVRSQMARTSPMMTAIHDLLPHIDSDVLVAVAPKICDQLRASIGVSTRSAAAQLITQLSLRAPQLMLSHKSQCDKFFNALLHGVRDRNPSIRKQFANSMSYLAKFVSTQQMGALVKSVVADLLKDNEDQKQSARHVLRNLSQNCGELLKGYATDIVPYIFLETCMKVEKGDTEAKKKQEEWAELWSELVPSTSGAVRTYTDEIVDVAVNAIKNNEVWSVRAQAARMISQTAKVLFTDGMNPVLTERIVNELLPTLSGRIWDGKSDILTAIATAVEAGYKPYREMLTTEKAAELAQVLQRESSKRNQDYSSTAMQAAALVAASLGDKKTSDWIANKVQENLKKLTDERDAEDSDDEMNGLSNVEREIKVARIASANLTALAIALRAYEKDADTKLALSTVCRLLGNSSIAWKAKQEMIGELQKTVEYWETKEKISSGDLVETLFQLADHMCEIQKKTVAFEALQVIVKMMERRDVFNVNWSDVSEKLRNGSSAKETGIADRLKDEPMDCN